MNPPLEPFPCRPFLSCTYDYQLVSKCTGHSGSIEHIDWTLPISVPGTKLNGTMIIRAVDESKNLLYWDPRTGKKVMQNQRDAPMATDTSRVGFNVMGIWPGEGLATLAVPLASLNPKRHGHLARREQL